MPREKDLRVIRTRQMIKDAFVELMETVGFSNITVESLTKKANISRNTFYLHYTDKFALLDQFENEILNDLKTIVMNIPIAESFAVGEHATVLSSFFVKLYEYIHEHHKVFQLFMNKNAAPSFLYKLHETIKAVLTEKKMINKFKIPENYALAFIVGVQTSFINEWLNSGMKESPQEIVAIIVSIVKDIPTKILTSEA